MGITAHCLVKNEENFIAYAILSVVDFVDQIIVFDTGSTDKTIKIVRDLQNKYPNKIIFEEKGPCDKTRHTELRQEMLEKTKTDWFMILDGDEVWTRRGIEEAKQLIEKGVTNVVETLFYECVGDIYHTHRTPGYKTIRFAKCNEVKWQGNYGVDTLISIKTGHIISKDNEYILKNRFWHLTHLKRSNDNSAVLSSGGERGGKQILTYFVVGKKISEGLPEVFGENAIYKLNSFKSFFNFILWIIKKLTKKAGKQ